MTDGEWNVVGIGNAIVDVLANAEDRFLTDRGLVKGSMNLIDGEQADSLYREMDQGMVCSGGSAANTMVGIASLGGRAAFIGKVRDDDLGEVFRRDLRAAGVAFDTPAAEDGPGSGRSLILVTSDAQRTMNTFLGVAGQLGPDEIDRATIEAAQVTYLEGYLWDPPPAKAAFLEAARIAHAAGRKVALSLSDSFCVDRHRQDFRDLVGKHVDVLFANEAEILSLYEASDLEAAVAEVQRQGLLAALTLGEKGALVVRGDERIAVAAEPVAKVIDTTGAGDLFASGFLHGLTRDCDLETCARLGAITAGEIIGHYGARPETRLDRLIEERGLRVC